MNQLLVLIESIVLREGVSLKKESMWILSNMLAEAHDLAHYIVLNHVKLLEAISVQLVGSEEYLVRKESARVLFYLTNAGGEMCSVMLLHRFRLGEAFA